MFYGLRKTILSSAPKLLSAHFQKTLSHQGGFGDLMYLTY
uniref:Uncharacterized protein n=1 Tax=Proteus mirabilis TaxID=584 RepID=A0A346FVQ4_PROMI|nr:Hypothetical protein [Proteus mirabilis]